MCVPNAASTCAVEPVARTRNGERARQDLQALALQIALYLRDLPGGRGKHRFERTRGQPLLVLRTRRVVEGGQQVVDLRRVGRFQHNGHGQRRGASCAPSTRAFGAAAGFRAARPGEWLRRQAPSAPSRRRARPRSTGVRAGHESPETGRMRGSFRWAQAHRGACTRGNGHRESFLEDTAGAREQTMERATAPVASMVEITRGNGQQQPERICRRQ